MKHAVLFFLSFSFLLTPAKATADVQSLVAGNTAFALDLYQQLAAGNPGSNIFFSPYSISTCMAMTFAGARGNTESEMSRVLGFDTNQQPFASTFGELQDQLLSEQQANAIELNIANALWTQIGFPFLPGFLETATNQYQANVNQADFVADPGAASRAINDWVAQQTQDKIQDLLPPGAINSASRMVLANAIYFKGAWTHSFAETNTSIHPFYVSSASQVQAPIMHQPLHGPLLNYMQTADLQALELPYGTNQFSMLILLPTRVDGLSQLERQLSFPFLSNVLTRMLPFDVEVFLPRFTNESSFNLTATLSQMGISDAFAQGIADFSAMDGSRDLFLSFVFHKAWGEVNEEGTVAAAATGGGGATSGRGPPPPVFWADHPFIFFIQDTRTGSLLFMGRVVNPTHTLPSPVLAPQLTLTRAGGTLLISWPYPSTPWTLQQSSDPSGTNWTSVAARGVLVAGWPFTMLYNDGTNNLLPSYPQAGNAFFRLSQH